MNETIRTQLNHRSIRKFKQDAVPQEIITQLVDVARHTATSNFMQSYSIIGISDKEKMTELSLICQQPYVAQASHIFLFVADQYRNEKIAESQGQETSVLQNMDRFMIAMTDASLAIQNVNVAAESLGLGTVFLGSVLNDAPAVVDLFNLPKMTFPILGLAVGYPDQEPQLKPRLPQSLMYFDNSYPDVLPLTEELAKYDNDVTQYYDLRDANTRVDSFTKQITDGMNRKMPKRLNVLKDIQAQGLIQE